MLTNNVNSAGSGNFMEQLMATQLTTSLLTSGNMSIPKILLIVGIDQIKRILMLLVDKFIERINKFDYNTGICVIAFIKRIFSKLCKNFLFNRQRRYTDDTDDTDDTGRCGDGKTCRRSEFICDIVLQKSFWEFVYQDMQYTITRVSDAVQVNNTTITSKEIWKNINIKTSDFDIYIDEVSVDIEMKNGKKQIIAVNNIKEVPWKIPEVGSIKGFEDYIPDKHILSYYRREILQYKSDITRLTENLRYVHYVIDGDVELQNFIIFALAITYTACSRRDSGKVKFSDAVICKEKIHDMITKDKYLCNTGYMPGTSNVYGFTVGSYSRIDGIISYLFNPSHQGLLINLGWNIWNTFDTDILKRIINHLLTISGCSRDKLPFISPVDSDIKQSDGIQMIVTSNTRSTHDTSLSDKVFTYINELSACKITDEKCINIHTIKINRTATIVKVPTDEYKQWSTKYSAVNDALCGDIKNTELLARRSDLLQNTPEQYATTTKEEHCVACELINECYRDLSNMYLSKKDYSALNSMLTLFRDNKNKCKRLGIPNKLVAGFYGTPGCGKTTCLTAIASFLNRDIYYLDLNSVKSNQELGMLFDYATGQTAKGSCIICEDIDVNTNVILRTTDATRAPETTTELLASNESPLTLEYFLNILDGVLLRDDTVFIWTTNRIDRIEPSFYRKGRCNILIEFKQADHHQIGQMFQRFFGRAIRPDILEKIEEYKFPPVDFITRFSEFILIPDADDAHIMELFI